MKVASRCNLACDYCYMYEHADQSWRGQPHLISADVECAVAQRIAEYVRARSLSSVSVVLHGGEPLLLGAKRLAAFARDIRLAMPTGTRCDVSMQTNGVLLTSDAIDVLAAADIGISVSLDGPVAANDLHRVTASGESTHAATAHAVALLTDRPNVFAGVIAVIDPATKPRDVLAYFSSLRVPALDLLLPDANHVRRPVGRDRDPNLYLRWLIEAFDIWFDEYPELRLRTFDALLASVCGRPSPTDAFGLGSVSLLTIETDGTYHDLDVLKITEEGATSLGYNVLDHSIEVAASAPRLRAHDRLLSLLGLSDDCKRCPEVHVCGGGAVPHRYDTDGFSHPSVYCNELLGLIGHVRRRLVGALASARPTADARRTGAGVDLVRFDLARSASPFIDEFMQTWRAVAGPQFRAAVRGVAEATDHPSMRALLDMSDEELAALSTTPSAVLWTRMHIARENGRPLRSLDGQYLTAKPDDLTSLLALPAALDRRPYIFRDDRLLRLPFGDPIVFLDQEDDRTVRAVESIDRALALIGEYDDYLRAEIRLLCNDIQLVVDTSAHPDKVVSFSDDSVPGALYVSPVAGGGLVGVIDLADSIIHEHRHQKLYLLSRHVDLVAADRPLVQSPWRAEPRPPSGVLHAVFVFAELHAFWRWVGDTADGEHRARAVREVEAITNRLREGVAVLDGVALTPAGRRLVAVLARRAEL